VELSTWSRTATNNTRSYQPGAGLQPTTRGAINQEQDCNQQHVELSTRSRTATKNTWSYQPEAGLQTPEIGWGVMTTTLILFLIL